jgi:Cu2+-exporting ATPase
MQDFYQHRATPDTRPDDKVAPVTNWETYERPAVMREFVRNQDDETQIADLLIQGVHCAACTWLIETTLQKIPGVTSIEVNPVTTRAELHWNPQQINLARLMGEIQRIGYLPTPFTEQTSYQATRQEQQLALRRLLVAGLGMMQVTSFAIALYAGAFQGMDANIQEFLRLISLLVATPVVLYSGTPFFTGAWRNIRARKMGMDVPVALAIGAAWAASVWNTFAGSGEVFFDSATMFVFFLSGTRYLEAAGRHRALNLTNALAQHIPCTANRITAAGTEEIGVMELQPGDRVQVAPGVTFPADGMLETATARIDESMLTGESAPVLRTQGDAVVAGTVNLSTTAVLLIDKTGADTVLAQIGRLVTMAGNAKPKLVQLTDRIASVFVSTVLILALGTGIGWWLIDPDRAFEIVLTVLVVTCPCALALATPAAFTVATSSLARQGFLVRRAGALQTMAKVTHIVFDKTGTLTENALEVATTEALAETAIADVTAIAAALENHSAHPIGRAFSNATFSSPATDVNAVAGGGLEGQVAEKAYRIGTAEFAASLSNTTAPDPVPNETRRIIYLGNKNGLLARFTLTEEIRAGASELFAQLRQQSITTTVASGDQQEPVAALASTLGADNWQAAMLPEDKLLLVQQLQNDAVVVAAVGDGVNDSPVLAGANVSIAMGSGTSIAQHSSDCVWLGNRLDGLDGAFALARRTMRIVKQNLAWALCYNILAIPLAVSGSIDPWMAALGMSLSSLLVMLNALRLGKVPSTKQPTEAVKTGCCSKQAGLAT